MRLLAFLLATLVVGPAVADTVTVFAAASLRGALDEAAAAWSAASGHDTRLVYAGSSTLARQIEEGAPADLFISANPQWMDRLEERGRLAGDTRVDLVGNALVLVADRPLTVAAEGPALVEAVGDERLAMGLVDAVPAGLYGRAALDQVGAWEALADNVVEVDNVRAALALVDRGEVGFGIVYATDARLAPDVHVAATFPPGSHPPIVYPAAVVAGGDREAPRALLAHLASDGGRAVFEAHGFTRPR